jgi:hypothetical protein
MAHSKQVNDTVITAINKALTIHSMQIGKQVQEIVTQALHHHLPFVGHSHAPNLPSSTAIAVHPSCKNILKALYPHHKSLEWKSIEQAELLEAVL